MLVSAIPGIILSRKDITHYFWLWAWLTTTGLVFTTFYRTPRVFHPELSDSRLAMTAPHYRLVLFHQDSGFHWLYPVSQGRLALVSAWIRSKRQYTCLWLNLCQSEERLWHLFSNAEGSIGMVNQAGNWQQRWGANWATTANCRKRWKNNGFSLPVQ